MDVHAQNNLEDERNSDSDSDFDSDFDSDSDSDSGSSICVLDILEDPYFNMNVGGQNNIRINFNEFDDFESDLEDEISEISDDSGFDESGSDCDF